MSENRQYNLSNVTWDIPLVNRALLGDVHAARVIAWFKRNKPNLNKRPDLNLRGSADNHLVGIKARTDWIDSKVKSLLARRSSQVVLNLGCGFCTRYNRLDLLNATNLSKWFHFDKDVDIGYLRAKALPTNCFELFFKLNLMEDTIPYGDIIIAEGVFEYIGQNVFNTHLNVGLRPGTELIFTYELDNTSFWRFDSEKYPWIQWNELFEYTRFPGRQGGIAHGTIA